MKTYSVLIGARNSGSRWSPADDRAAERITLKHFPGGCSILRVRGAWYDPGARSFRHEEARQILVTAPAHAQLRAWCRELGRALGQRELMVIEQGRAHRFVVAEARRASRRT